MRLKKEFIAFGKMKLKNIINKSYYCTIGHVSSESDLELHERYILYNLPVLKEFKQHIIVVNYSTPLQQENTKLWRHYFPNCVILDLEENRGHSFGIADQENAIIDYCHENDIDWVCKSSHDVVFQPTILDIKVNDSDFYYMNGIGFGGMEKYNFDLDKISKEDFYPQTNFYFIDTTKIDYLYDKKYVNDTYDYIQNLEVYSGRVWEHIEGWTCEDFLKKCVIRNNLSKYHLVSHKKYRILLETIKHQQIHDCSHKNIMMEGICHFQHPDQNILII